MMVERRRYPRLDAALPLELVLADGTVLSAKAVNVSIEGLQFSCSHEAARRIVPRGYVATPGERVEVQVRLTLPFTDQEAEIDLRCRVITLRRLSADEYRFGLAFVELEGRVLRLLERYVQALMRRP